MDVRRGGNGYLAPWKLGLRTKFSRKLDVSSSIPIN